jgi:ribosomal protein L34E
MKKFKCPNCGVELDSIENRASSWLEWNGEKYAWNDPWDAGSYYCTECGAQIDDHLLKEVVEEAC